MLEFWPFEAHPTHWSSRVSDTFVYLLDVTSRNLTSRTSARNDHRDGSAGDAPQRAGRPAREAAQLDALRAQLLRALRTYALRRAAAVAAAA